MKTMNSTQKCPILLFMLIVFSFNGNSQSQFYLSEVWDMEGGSMPVFYRNNSTTDNMRNVYVVGSTYTDSSGNDILLQKFNKYGVLLWEQSFDGGANSDDIGADVFVDNNYNVFVTGGATQTSQNNLDLVVLKYNSSGVLQWSYFYNFGGSPIPYDGGTAITGDNNGSIYVTGTSSGTNTMTDFVSIKLNETNGNQVWTARYDFAQLNEAPAKISISGSSIIVTGASQSTMIPLIKWDLTTIRYNSSNGNTIAVYRTNSNSSSGIDEANDLTVDNNGNIYVVGATNNQTAGYNISILKFDDNLNLLWEQNFDGYGSEDKGFGVKTDTNGNIYAVGYVTNPNQGKNYSILKYNSSGTLQWSREFNGLANQDDEAIQLVVRGDRIFVTGAARNGSYSDIVTMGYTADGQIFSVKSFESQFGLNDKPTAMGIDLDDNLIVVGQMQDTTGNFRNVTFKYNVWEKPKVPVFDSLSKPLYIANEILVRFNPADLILSEVDDKKLTWGFVEDFVSEAALNDINALVGFNIGRQPCYKVFPRMTSTDTMVIGKFGNQVDLPPLYATFGMVIPENFVEPDLVQLMKNYPQHFLIATLNGIAIPTVGANDPHFNNGNSAGLTPITTIPDANINIEPAWDYATGDNSIIVGVFDTGINYSHLDLSYGNWQTSSVIDGYDYVNGDVVPIYTQSNPDASGHGTAVAGIIGAWRNNNYGIAGIAGGNNGNGGVTLHDMKIFDIAPDCDGWISTLGDIANAVQEGANGIVMPRQDIQNHSWYFNGVPEYFIREAFDIAYRNGVILIVSSGNSAANPALDNPCDMFSYPASYPDPMIIKVGGIDASGNRVNFSECGNYLDFIAPGTGDLYLGLSAFGSDFLETIIWPSEDGCIDSPINGTSFSTPHASGVAALMMSYNRQNVPTSFNPDLSLEDCEELMQMFATDIAASPSSPDYDNYTGWGRLNAGNVLQNLSYPQFVVMHGSFQTSTSDAVLEGELEWTYIETELPGTPQVTDIKKVNRWKVTATYNFEIPEGYEVIAAWGRGSASQNTIGIKSDPDLPLWHWITSGVVGSLHEHFLPAEPYVEVIDFDENTITVAGYIYEVYDAAGINQLGWYPVNNNSNVTFAYSLYLNQLPISTGLVENDINQIFNIYPNPTDKGFNIQFNANFNAQFIEITDISGNLVKTVLVGDNQTLYFSKDDLSSGLYFVNISDGFGFWSKKLVINK